MAEPEPSTKYRELERRSNRDPSYGETAQQAEETSKDERRADRAAVYMVERAAIRLRRLRWAQSIDDVKTSARIDDLASKKAGHWHEEPRPPSEPMSDQLLAQYARPDAVRDERSVTDRVVDWFKKGAKKGPSGEGQP